MMRTIINRLAKGVCIVSLLFAVPFSTAKTPSSVSYSEMSAFSASIRNLPVSQRLKVAKEKLNLDHNFLMTLKDQDKSLYCLAQNAFFEARGESFEGKVAVVEVTVNRANHASYPSDVCDVVRQRTTNKGTGSTLCQFSWYCTRKGSIPLTDSSGRIKSGVYQQWHESVAAAILVYKHELGGIVEGATNFYAHKRVNPPWAQSNNLKKYGLEKAGVVGNHTFLRPRDE